MESAYGSWMLDRFGCKDWMIGCEFSGWGFTWFLFEKGVDIQYGGFLKLGWAPKMDGENHGKPYEQMDDFGGYPTMSGNTHIVTYDLCHVQNFNDFHDQKDCTDCFSAFPFGWWFFQKKNCRNPQGLGMMSLPEGLVRSQLQAVADAEVQFLGFFRAWWLGWEVWKTIKKWYKRNATSKNGWKITIFNRIHTSPNSVWIFIFLLLFVLTWTWSFLRRFWGVFLKYTRDIWRWNYTKSPEWVSCLGSCPTPRRKNYWLEPENQPKNQTFSGYQWRVFKNYTFETRPCGLFIPPGWTYKPWNF